MSDEDIEFKGERCVPEARAEMVKANGDCQILQPSVFQLAVAESGVLARKAHVSQLKKYCLSVG